MTTEWTIYTYYISSFYFNIIQDGRMSKCEPILNNVYSYIVFLFTIFSVLPGGVHRSRHVCSKGEKDPCNTGRLWDGSCKGHEEGDREEHVLA